MFLLTEREARIRGEIWTILEVRGQSYEVRRALVEAKLRYGYPKDMYEMSRSIRRLPENQQVPPEALDEDWGRYERRWQMAFRGTVEQNRTKIEEAAGAIRRMMHTPPAEPVPEQSPEFPF